MAKTAPLYACQQCGVSHSRWAGRCDACGAWNSLAEERATAAAPPKGISKRGGRQIEFVPLHGVTEDPKRRLTGLAEFDRVCGGGLVPGSSVLVGGDPGIGKSTILLQTLAALANMDYQSAYISGEEAEAQIRMRARRLGLSEAPVSIASATNVRDILASLDVSRPPDVVVIDSIQTMFVDALDSAPGTVAQVRSSAQELIRLAKRRDISLLLVGHVTKEGMIAGPRVLEHMVDTVLYFEGERSHQFRILRTVKNRFGPTDEIGVFEMTGAGLQQVTNPSALFLADRRDNISGAAVFAGLEGTRPVLVEIQALVSPSLLGTPRRAVVGWDSSRLAMIMAVLDARCGLSLAGNDVYLNVAGGLRISEPGADLAVAAALISAHTDRSLPPETVTFGEVGLAGEIRGVGQAELRLKEAAKLGFNRAVAPPGRSGTRPRVPSQFEILEIDHLTRLLSMLDKTGQPTNRPEGSS